MPHYVLLMNWADQGIMAFKGNLRTTTLRGFPAEKFQALIQQAANGH
jgi:uncharacterized protein with GYD domain